MRKTGQLQHLKFSRIICIAALIAGASMAHAATAFEKIPVSDARAEDAKDAVKAVLKDPGSAQFRNLYTKGVGGKPIGNIVVCGEVNAKNSYGGYIGFTRFYQSKPGDSATLWSTEDWQNAAFGFLCD